MYPLNLAYKMCHLVTFFKVGLIFNGYTFGLVSLESRVWFLSVIDCRISSCLFVFLGVFSRRHLLRKRHAFGEAKAYSGSLSRRDLVRLKAI